MAAPPEPNRRRTTALLVAGAVVTLFGVGLPRLVGDAGPDILQSLARLALGVVVVAGLCVAVGRVVRPKPPAAAGHLTVLASLPVDARAAVYLVSAGGRRLLVGVDPAGVKALVEMPGPDPGPAAPVVVAATVPAGPSEAELAAWIKRLRGQ